MPKSKLVKNVPQPEIKPPSKKNIKKYIIIFALVAVLIGALAAGVYFYLQFQSGQKVAGVATVQEVDSLVERVGKLVELPQGEQVTLATVSDIQKLQDQPFFVRAQNGDKVLIYEQSKKAILYRPSTNKIIEIGPVTGTGQQSIAPSPSSATPSAIVTKPVRVAIYNGTTTNGLTRRAEGQLLALSSLHVEVTSKENAKENTYQESVIVDLTGAQQQVASQFASIFKGTVESLPEGEVKPTDIDILIILGSTYVEE